MQVFEKELVAEPRVACDYFLRWSHYYYYYYYFERERESFNLWHPLMIIALYY